jgi:hypothetical protein
VFQEVKVNGLVADFRVGALAEDLLEQLALPCRSAKRGGKRGGKMGVKRERRREIRGDKKKKKKRRKTTNISVML